MSKVEQNGVTPQYHSYLTEIGRGKQNPVINFVVDLVCSEKYRGHECISLADIGCFNGTMLDRIYESLPEGVRAKVRLHGYDFDLSMLDEGRQRFPYIDFRHVDLRSRMSGDVTHNIVVLSNILHEVYSEKIKDPKDAEGAVVHSLTEVRKTLDLGGDLVLLDGLKPKDSQKLVTVYFPNPGLLEDLRLLKSVWHMSPIHLDELGECRTVISLRDLGTFLTKAKYLHKDFWKDEVNQVYQCFDMDEYSEILKRSGFKVVRSVPQLANSASGISIESPSNIALPAKSILIHAQRI